MPIATFLRRALFAGDTFGAVALMDTNILVLTAILRPPNRRQAVLRFRAVGRPRCIPSSCPPLSNGALTMGPLVGRTPKPCSSPTSFPSDLVRLGTASPFGGTPRQAGLRGACRLCLSFRGRATQGASAEADWAALLLFPRLVLRPMADFTSAGHLPPVPVADYRDNRLAHWAS
jgi:hypothetical protein